MLRLCAEDSWQAYGLLLLPLSIITARRDASAVCAVIVCQSVKSEFYKDG